MKKLLTSAMILLTVYAQAQVKIGNNPAPLMLIPCWNWKVPTLEVSNGWQGSHYKIIIQ